MKYEIQFTNQFKKSLKKAKKQGKNLDKLYRVIEELAKGEMLPPKFRDHKLVGYSGNVRECHIDPDWLLVYEIIDNELVLSVLNIGSHSELF